MDTETPNVMAAVAAQLADEERRTLKAKDAGRAVLAAVLAAEPESLPESVRVARARVLGLAGE
jgi:hypothetical protein